ncbi:unnamed protein product [Blepharisma stoltei]|uniref:Tetratricopeptide repeat protein n=1 Tax=Blepharisma stoltei TaxID=1481888 RepID=A0AAU9IW12_9CILI|nr:unnamed protein product [Blepharisma stoltei]
MQNSPEIHDKASVESVNVKDSTSFIISSNSESSKGPENINKIMENNLEKNISLLNSQITVSNELNNKPKETESALKVINILRNKTAEILSIPNNRELEIDFRTTCSAIQNNSSLHDPLLMQAYQDYLNAYQRKASLYNIARDYEENRTNLYIYNTETETEEVKTVQIPQPLSSCSCITQLPNGKLFCFGSDECSGTMLIDMNGRAKMLPSGAPHGVSSIIYFSNSVYCFEGERNLSSRFDLDQNRWIKLSLMPKAYCWCNSIIFNRNILISGSKNRNLLLYSIDINSFSTIPYEFEKHKIKILINAERLYLIECCGWIYENEVGSYLNWRRIRKSSIDNNLQVHWVYNKGGICISTTNGSVREYYYFNLDQKIITDKAYYSKYYLLRRVGKEIESIKWNNQNFKLDPYNLDEWSLKGMSLKELGNYLEEIIYYDKKLKEDPNYAFFYYNKGNAFYCLERYLKAIECYDKAIKLDPNETLFYFNKGNAFYGLKKYLKAIEFYDKAIEHKPSKAKYYYHKGNAFYGLERYLEAIECYEEAIKVRPNDADFYWKKGSAFNELGRYLKAIECYDEAIIINPNNADFCRKKVSELIELRKYQEAEIINSETIKINPNNAKFYNDKGNTLYVLERYQEAIQCYDEAIKLKPNNPLHFCNRARVFDNLRQEEAALQDFNTAYNLWQQYQESAFVGNGWELSEKDIKFIDDILGWERIELLQKCRFK